MEREVDDIISKLLDGTIAPEERSWLEEEMAKDLELKAAVEKLILAQEVENFVEGNLTSEAMKHFEDRLEKDSELQEAVQAYNSTKAILELDQRERYTELFKQIGEDNHDDGPKKWRFGWFVLIPIVLLMGVGYFYFKPSQLPNTGEIIQQSPAESEITNNEDENIQDSRMQEDSINPGENILEPSDSITNEASTKPIATNPDEPTSLQSALLAYGTPPELPRFDTKGIPEQDSIYNAWRIAYDSSKYQQVLSIISTMNGEYPEDRRYVTMLALGIAYYVKKDYEAALEQFDNILSTGFFTNATEDAQWFKGLAQLQLNRTEDGQNTLQYLVENRYRKHFSKAEALLELLER